MADEKAAPEYHPRNEINDYVRRNYVELANVKDTDIAIGVAGGIYRVMVTDAFKVTHTLRIDPKSIDADQKKALAKSAGKAAVGRMKQAEPDSNSLGVRSPRPKRRL